MIVPRSVAVQGLGFGAQALATQGFVSGLYVQVGGFGQVVAFGLPTVGIGGGALLIEVPSLATLVKFGLPSLTGGLPRPARLFVRSVVNLWRVITQSPNQ